MEPRRLRRVLAAVLLVGLSAGCTTADGVNTETPTPGTTTTAVSGPTPTTEEQRVLAQYAAFWKILTPTSEAPESQRRELLARYATDPELTRALGGMRAADRLGEVLYGEVVPRPTVTKIEGDSASIRDCQNASNAGRRERATGEIVTRGTTHDLALVSLKRGPDGVWRVATVEYQQGASC